VIGMYAILRTQKLKTVAALARSARHTFRDQPTPNAHSERTANNIIIGCGDTSELLDAVEKRLPASRRRDAVMCIEYLITASPEAFSRHGGSLGDLGSGYFRDAIRWLRERHGTANVLCAALHLDESTPHLVAYVVPMTKDGRLSARDFLGGPKAMRSMQDSFYSACGESRGLLRGVQGSKAKHEKISAFYTTLIAAGEAPELKFSDYAAKAVGLETKAWRDAEAVSKKLVQTGALGARGRKANLARLKVLEDEEKKLKANVEKLEKAEIQLRIREKKVAQLEHEVALLKPELLIAKAQVEAMERLLEDRERRDKEVAYSHIKARIKANAVGLRFR
tara:strand:- start:3024 stop:4031 length:1008 start_codon:yes stop_codon:yes gene_type:complete